MAHVVAPLAVLLLFACASSTTQEVKTEPAARPRGWEQELERVRVQRDGEQTLVTLVGLEEPAYRVLPQDDADVLVLELPGVYQASPSLFDALFEASREWPVRDVLVKGVSTANATANDGPLTRVEVRLAEPADHFVESTPDGVVLRFTTPVRTAAVSAGPAAPEAIEQPSAMEAPTAVFEIEAAGQQVARVAPLPDRPASVLTAIRVTTTRSGILVHLEADGVIDSVDSFTVPDPDRLVVDLPGLERAGAASTPAIDSALVTRVRLGVHPHSLRIVLDAGPHARSFQEHRLVPVASGLVVTVGTGSDLDDLLAATRSATETPAAVATTP